MKRLLASMTGAAISATVVLTIPAHAATTWDLTGGLRLSDGLIGLNANATFESDEQNLAAEAHRLGFSSGQWSYTQHNTKLTQSVVGLGVRSPLDGLLQAAQIDNMAFEELIRFKLPDGYSATSSVLSVGLSADDYVFWENDDGALPEWSGGFYNLTFIALNGDLITSGHLSGTETIALATTKGYLFVAGNRFVDGANDGFAVKSLTAEVPIPALLPALLVAIGGLGVAGFRQRSVRHG